MKVRVPTALRVLLFFAGLSFVTQGFMSGSPKRSSIKSNSDCLSKAQVEWWSPSGLVLEPEDFEESAEEVNEITKSFAVVAPNILPTISQEIGSSSFLVSYSGRLQFLNIPPPCLS